ncbi:MAG TPA: hypothetical protein VN712_00795 [Dermatophilaceae bacterium]|nr:hypothetical protein [Dermatophilaceae bacterium]
MAGQSYAVLRDSRGTAYPHRGWLHGCDGESRSDRVRRWVKMEC